MGYSMIYLTGDTHGFNDIASVKKYFVEGHDPDGRKVTKDDFILSHTCPGKIARQLVNHIIPGEEEMQRYFDDMSNEVDFKGWYFGHWHMDTDIGKFHTVYNNVVKIG